MFSKGGLKMNHKEYVRLMNVVATLHHDNDYEYLKDILNQMMGYEKDVACLEVIFGLAKN